MFASDPRACASGIHALGRALPVWGIQPRPTASQATALRLLLARTETLAIG